jgi:hypothetical protein
MDNEIEPRHPTRAPADIAGSEASRARWPDPVVVPRLFFVPIGAAVAVQIGTTAAGVAGAGESPSWLLAAGFAVFLGVSAVQLARLHRLNDMWLGAMISRVIGGTARASSTSYLAALAAAIWAALAGAWWLLPLCAAAGGTAYAVSGRSWTQKYRSEPGTHMTGESARSLAVVAALALAGLILLVAAR